MLGDPIQRIKSEVEGFVDPYRKSAFTRFPFLFTFLGATGAAAVFYGFELSFGQVSLFAKYPWILILIGILILYLTGKLYKKLD